MTQAAEPSPASFAYQAQTADGLALSGTIDAKDAEHASQLLHQLRLRVLQLDPAAHPVRPRALRGDDFLAFNQQLTQLTSAGLPIEPGLRLIAQDMRNQRLGETIRQVADDLEQGKPLQEAFEKHAKRFPPLYGKLVAAGAASGNLPAMLLNLGRHLELVYRLRGALWRAFAYPLMVLAGLSLVLIFLGLWVIPQFETMFNAFHIKLPWATGFLLGLSHYTPAFIIIVLAIAIGVPLLWMILRMSGHAGGVSERMLLPLPLVGPVLKRNLVARWCDALRLGVMAGLDLPRAIGLADDAIASPRLRQDGQLISAMLEAGQPIGAAAGRTSLLPATVPAAMDLARQDLPQALASLSEMYQQQAEMRVGLIPVLLTPILLLIIACVIAFVILSMFMPFLVLIKGMTGP